MPTTTHRAHVAGAALLLALAVGGLTACGDDGEDATDTTTTSSRPAASSSTAPEEGAATSEAGAVDPDLEEYCAVAAELNATPAPTAEQIEGWAALAPAEIADAAATLVAAFEAAGGELDAVFADPDATAAIEEVTAFEAEECGLTPPGPPGSPAGG